MISWLKGNLRMKTKKVRHLRSWVKVLIGMAGCILLLSITAIVLQLVIIRQQKVNEIKQQRIDELIKITEIRKANK